VHLIELSFAGAGMLRMLKREFLLTGTIVLEVNEKEPLLTGANVQHTRTSSTAPSSSPMG